MTGLFPILSLYEHNIYETSPRSLVLSTGLTLSMTLTIWLGLGWLSRNRPCSAVATSLLVALFFAFNHCRRAAGAFSERLSHDRVRQEVQVQPLLMLVLMSLAANPAMCAIFRWKKDPELWAGLLNVFSLIPIAIPSGTWLSPGSASLSRRSSAGEGGSRWPYVPPTRLPNVYFIVLDAYARSVVWSDLSGYDTEESLRRLEQKEFDVARKSRSSNCRITPQFVVR